jgi:nicotinate-nucleotide pyrophosphorylase (carboxylating)
VAKRLKAKWPHLIVEASGGITIDTMSQFFSPYVDIISQGSLTSG